MSGVSGEGAAVEVRLAEEGDEVEESAVQAAEGDVAGGRTSSGRCWERWGGKTVVTGKATKQSVEERRMDCERAYEASVVGTTIVAEDVKQ